MARFRQVETAFWGDPFVQSCSPEEKYFYLFLFTNAKTSACGIYEITIKDMEHDTGYNTETVTNLLHRFIQYKKVKYDQKTHTIYLLNWIYHNAPKGPATLACVIGELNRIKNKDFVASYFEKAGELGYPLDGAYRGPIGGHEGDGRDTPDPRGDKEKDKEKDKDKDKDTSGVNFTDDDLVLAKHVFGLIRQLNPKHQEPSFDKWAKDIRLMRERDGRALAEIRSLFEWANNDSFWKTNILSPATLRKQWDKLTIQRNHRGTHDPNQRADNSVPGRIRSANGIRR